MKKFKIYPHMQTAELLGVLNFQKEIRAFKDWQIIYSAAVHAGKTAEFSNQENSRAIKVFFQDETWFGRIDNLCSCWVPPKGSGYRGQSTHKGIYICL
ncbi:hypothetical protein EZS27_038374 [termite gut metagenome]|uniref:Uncharacterized protein n=3 Tax=termite gut metagenome TaxID=433724 RepID=A0A5J4PPR7_9ZZZZ